MIIDFIKGNGGGGSGSGYTLPTATSSRLGGVKIGSGIDVQNDGTISVSGGSADLSNYWTSGETKSYVDGAISGAASDYYTSVECDNLFAPAGAINEIMNEIIPAIGDDISDLKKTKADYYRFELSTFYPDNFTRQDIENLNDFFAAVSGNTSLIEGAYFNVNDEIFRLSNYSINGSDSDFTFYNAVDNLLQSISFSFANGEYSEGYYYDNDLGGQEEVISRALNDLNDRKVDGDGITNIVSISQSDYDRLSVYDPSTLYVIINNN